MVVGFFSSGVDPLMTVLKECGLYLGEPDRVKRNVTNEDLAQTGMRLTEVYTPDNRDDLKYVEPYLRRNWIKDQKLRAIKMAYDLVVWKMNELSRGREWGFRSRRALVHLPMYINKMPNLKIVIMVRSPSAVVHSLMNSKQYNEKYGFGWDESELQKHWNNYYRIARRDLQRYSPSYMVVRFEDLMADTECTIQRVCQFTGLKYNYFATGLIKRKPPKNVPVLRVESGTTNRWFQARANEDQKEYICSDNDTPRQDRFSS